VVANSFVLLLCNDFVVASAPKDSKGGSHQKSQTNRIDRLRDFFVFVSCEQFWFLVVAKAHVADLYLAGERQRAD
jgi:hypothetical protein